MGSYALRMDNRLADYLIDKWALTARPAQRPLRGGWDVWVMLAGRGFGKTRAGAQWIADLVHPATRRGPKSHLRIALVAASLHEARSIMVEGESGILSLYPSDAAGTPHPGRPRWEPSRRQLTWPNGARAFIYGAAEANSLRGPQHHFAWCDEIAKWDNGDEAWMNLRMGLRLGKRPRVLATTTPRHCALVTDLVRKADANTKIFVSRGRMDDNKSVLPAAYREGLEEEYGGSWKGRQELDGELFDGAPDALWTRTILEAARARHRPHLPRHRVVIGVDPSASRGGDACGIIVAALTDPLEDGAGTRRNGTTRNPRKGVIILADCTIEGASPDVWANAVADAAERWNADLVIAESNQGGEMVKAVLQASEHSLPVRLLHASRGKAARAEPVAIWYEQGRVCHAASFPALEDQLCGLSPDGSYHGPGRSPDRADALVYAVSTLLGNGGGDSGPRVLMV